jgi:release factor glutamine methyltransferase
VTTLSEAVAGARRRLQSAGLDGNEAALDARLLASHVLGWDAARFLTYENEPAPAGFDEPFARAVERRASREPFAYIVGVKEFWDLSFVVGPGVLVPRPETELLIDAALEFFPQRDRQFYAADAGTGSGCIAVALAKERPRAVVLATDISPDALAIAQENARRHRVTDRIEFLATDLLDGAPDPFDLILSNPPYVPAHEAPMLQPEVRDYEPAIALFSGDDGLNAIRRLIPESVLRLSPGGLLMFEFGMGQGEAVEQLILATPGLRLVDVRPDLQGIPRISIAQRISDGD